MKRVQAEAGVRESHENWTRKQGVRAGMIKAGVRAGQRAEAASEHQAHCYVLLDCGYKLGPRGLCLG